MTNQWEYHKGEGGGLPEVRAVVSFVSLCVAVFVYALKMFQIHINQLVAWFV
jgi:hypothetical protein